MDGNLVKNDRKDTCVLGNIETWFGIIGGIVNISMPAPVMRLLCTLYYVNITCDNVVSCLFQLPAIESSEKI